MTILAFARQPERGPYLCIGCETIIAVRSRDGGIELVDEARVVKVGPDHRVYVKCAVCGTVNRLRTAKAA